MHNLYIFGIPGAEKTSFEVSLIHEVMLKGVKEANIKNFMNFMQSDQFDVLSINDLIQEYLTIFNCRSESPLLKIDGQTSANSLIHQCSAHRKKNEKNEHMSTSRVLSALSYLSGQLTYRDKLAADYVELEDQKMFCP